MPSMCSPLIERSREFLSLRADRTRTLRTNFLWNAAGSGVFALSQWAILIAFAKLGSPALVGKVVYGLALAAPIFVVSNLQLRSIQATDAANEHPLGQYLGLRTLTTGAAVVVAICIAAGMWFFDRALAPIVLCWALSKAVDSGSDVLYGLFQHSERMDYVGFSLTARGILAIACVAVLFRTTRSAPVALAGMVVGWMAVFVLFDIPAAHRLLRGHEQTARRHRSTGATLRPILDPRRLRALSMEAAPLGIVALLLTLQVQIPRYVVAGLLHNRALGLFSAAAYLTFTGSMLVNSLGAPACVKLAQHYVSGDRFAFRQLMAKLLLVAAALGAAGVLVSFVAGGRILTLLYTKEYAGMAGVLTTLCAAGALSYLASFLGYGMTSLHRYGIQVPIFLIVVVLTLASCFILTGKYGLMGTAAGVLIGNLGQLLMSAAVVWRATRRSLPASTACEMVETQGPAA